MTQLDFVCLKLSLYTVKRDHILHECVSYRDDVYWCVAVGTLLCHQQILAVPEGQAMWKQVLLGGYVHSLCRDEVIHVHVFASEFFDTVKG